MFWQSLPWHALPFALLFGGINSSYTAADRELLYGVSRAVNMSQVREELRDYFMARANLRWRRRDANIRVPTTRLKTLAKQYLPDPGGGAFDVMQEIKP